MGANSLVVGASFAGCTAAERLAASAARVVALDNRPENKARHRKYCEPAAREEHVTFAGCLAQHHYDNMDQAVGAALKCAQRLLVRKEQSRGRVLAA